MPDWRNVRRTPTPNPTPHTMTYSPTTTSPTQCCEARVGPMATGLVGAARKDGTNGALAVLQYLRTLPPPDVTLLAGLPARLAALPRPVVTKADLQRLEAAEHAQAAQQGLEEFKFGSDAEMLAAMGLG